MDSLTEAVLITDAHQRIVYGNASANRFLGNPAGGLAGRILSELISAPSEAMDLGQPVIVRARVGDGQFRDAEITFSSPEDDEPEILVAILRDAPRRDLEDDSSRKLRAILETISVGVLLSEGPNGRLTVINPAAHRIAGSTISAESYEEFARKYPLQRLDGRVMDLTERPLARTFDSGRPVHEILKYQRADGKEVVLAVTTSPFPGPNGGAVTTFADVTERFMLDQDLADRATQLRALLDHLPVGVAYFDKMAVCRAGNGPARRYLGRTRSEIEGASADELFALAPELREALQRCVTYNAPHEQKSVSWPDAARPGSIRFLDWQFEPLSSDPAKSRGALALLVDVTERTHAEQELQRAKTVAEDASRRKTEFLSAISHDLRTPVNALSLQAELLARIVEFRDDPGGELRLLSGDIRAVAANLIELINDLLDLTRFDSGVVDFHPSEFALDPWLANTVAPLELSARTKGLDFQWSVDQPGRFLRTDRVKLGRLLVNLVGNAIKFTERGEVSITARVDREGWFNLEVRDTGPGIPAHQIDRIFDEFSQLRNPERDRTKGTGLGLAICRRLIEVVGGRLTVQSELGKGSLFTAAYPPSHVVDTPNPMVDTAETDVISPGPVSRTSILLVEDDPNSRNALARLLEHSGFHVETASSGLQALAVLEHVDPALILLDLLLPEMDGAEVLRHIRADDRHAQTKVIVLTGDVMDDRGEWLETLGADGLLAKPIDLASLLEAVQSMLPMTSP